MDRRIRFIKGGVEKVVHNENKRLKPKEATGNLEARGFVIILGTMYVGFIFALVYLIFFFFLVLN